MPATTLILEDGDNLRRLMFITQQFDEGFTLNIHNCNEDYIPVGDPLVRELVGNEEDYHKKLRADSYVRGHLVSGHSTNPEWNPGVDTMGAEYGC